MKKLLFGLVVLFLISLACNLPVPQSIPSNEPGIVISSGSQQTQETKEIEAISTSSGASPTGVSSQVETWLDCPGEISNLITGIDVLQTPASEDPTARQPFRDPVFGTCLVRVTERQKDPFSEDETQGLKNEYSRVQAFNSNGSFFLIHGLTGSTYLYDSSTLLPISLLPVDIETRWDAVDPHLLYFNSGTQLKALNVVSGETSLVHDFAKYFPGQEVAAVWMRWEGSPSVDTRFWGFMAENQDWIPTAFIVYDRLADQVTVRDVSSLPGIDEDVDHVTMSTLGNYFLASLDHYCEPGKLGDDAHPCGLMVYDRNLQNGRSLLRIIGHYDTALDADGREVIVFGDIDTDTVAVLDLESGTVTRLWDIDFSHTPIGMHFSGLAFQKPGWALMSTHDGDPASYTWMDDQVIAFELKPEGRIIRLAHTHSLVDENQEHDYWAEPHGMVNQDFTRMLFTSNWGRSGTEEVDTFMIQLEPGWDQ